MGINLNDYIEDVNQLFTFEEAEKLFIAAGYTKKSVSIEGFEQVKITHETLMKRSSEEYPKKIEGNSDFEISVKSTHLGATTLIKSFVYDLGEINVKESKSNNLGGPHKLISKLKINSIRVEKSIFESNPEFSRTKNNKENDLAFNVEILINKSNDSIGMIRLGCEINIEKIEESPFFMDVNILGEFSADGESFKDFVINAISLLFPYLRAHISTVTSISGVDPVIIPAINIMDLLKEKEEETETETVEEE